MTKLQAALRQYRHNDSNDFVVGYDRAEVDKVFLALEEELQKRFENINSLDTDIDLLTETLQRVYGELRRIQGGEVTAATWDRIQTSKDLITMGLAK